MARNTTKTVLLGGNEITAGVDPSLTAGSNTVLFRVSGKSVDVGAVLASRDVARPYYAPTEQVHVARDGSVNFSTDLVGSGTAGTPSGLGYFFKACNLVEVISAGSRVEYTPLTTNAVTAAFYDHVDGRLMKFGYCVGNVKFNLRAGNVPTLDFAFRGIATAPSAASVPAPTYTPWKRAKPVNPDNTSGLLLGATYSAGSVSGGTSYDFTEALFDAGNDVQKLFCANRESWSVDGASAKLEVTVDCTAAQEVQFYADRAAGTLTPLAITHGVDAGYIFIFHAAAARLVGIQDAPNGKKHLVKLTYDLMPTTAGNDAYRLVFK